MTDCIFCKIVKGEIPGKFVYKDSEMVAFYDISPKAPKHVLLTPVKHIKSLREVGPTDKELLGKMMLKAAEVAKDLGISEDGYKIVANNGKSAGQIVFHLHFHILGGWKKSPGWQV